MNGPERMADQKFTRCPGCSTVFRVTEAQLALREGQVRCGHCRAVFDANDHVVSLDGAPPPDDFDATDELMMGRPTVTLRSADALQPADAAATGEATTRATGMQAEGDDEAADADVARTDEGATDAEANGAARPDRSAGDDAHIAGAETAPEPAVPHGQSPIDAPDGAVVDSGETAPAGVAEPPVPAVPVDLAAVRPGGGFEWKKREVPQTSRRRVYGIAAAALIVGLALQGVIEFRDALAARAPATRPILESACDLLGCTIEPLRDATALSIDASDLQADPAHRGLLLLSATVRNRASHAIAFPYLELTLTDASDHVVARRAFPPAEYAGTTVDPHQGIPANGERVVRMFLDASATQQAGYRLYLFYP